MILPSVQFMLSRGFERRTERLTKVLCKCSVIIMLKAFLILKKMKQINITNGMNKSHQNSKALTFKKTKLACASL